MEKESKLWDCEAELEERDRCTEKGEKSLKSSFVHCHVSNICLCCKLFYAIVDGCCCPAVRAARRLRVCWCSMNQLKYFGDRAYLEVAMSNSKSQMTHTSTTSPVIVIFSSFVSSLTPELHNHFKT